MNKMQRTYKVIDFPPLTDEQKQEIDCLAAMKDEDIDTSDTKIDNDTLAWLKQAGKGYQTRLNAVLRWARMNGCPVNSF